MLFILSTASDVSNPPLLGGIQNGPLPLEDHAEIAMPEKLEAYEEEHKLLAKIIVL